MRSLFKQSDRANAHAGTPKRGSAGRAAPVQIMAVSERTSGLDENLGSLLGDMRLALGLTPGELALRLGSTVDLIMTLEQGRLRALPHWDETQRVITGLCALHRVDPRPILQRIYEQTSPTHLGAPPERGPGALHRANDRTSARPAPKAAAPEPATRRRTSHKASQSASPSPKSPATKKRWRGRPMRGRGRALMAVAGPMVLIAAAVWTVQAQPRALRDAISVLPASISKPVLGGLDTLAVSLAPRRDGLRWIEVADPSSRKADKLQVGSR